MSKITPQHSRARYIASEINRGFAGGNNLAIKQILNQDSSDTIMLINNDASVSEENIGHLIRSFETEPKLGIVGPIIDEIDGLHRHVSFGGKDISKYVHTKAYAKKNSQNEEKKLHYVDYVPGTIALIRTNLFRIIGFLDENYFFSGEMADFCERARQKGFLCAINANASGTHRFDSTSTIRQTLYLYYNLRNRFLFISKFRRSRKAYLYSFWIFYGTLMFIQALLRFQGKRAKAVMLALVHGIFGKFGNQNDKFLP
jgi:GT2 family glycosyltransferase